MKNKYNDLCQPAQLLYIIHLCGNIDHKIKN